MTVHAIHTEPEPALQDAWERGYAQAWTARATITRPDYCWLPVHARWAELAVGAVVLDNTSTAWIVTRHEPLAGQPNTLAVTITGGDGSFSWPSRQPSRPGKDVDERVWTLERVDIDEAQRIVTAQLRNHVLVRVNGDLPGQPVDPGVRWRWRIAGRTE